MRANSTTNDKKVTALRTPKLKKVQITSQISSKDPDSSTLQPFTKLSSTQPPPKIGNIHHMTHDQGINIKDENYISSDLD
jgi:hypothetical protein